ncbi:MAG: sulfatase-like hydrolase/transferase [Planctomycetes bacterium]|nr:sulfatase-like hydrolase/transferase [Planctomycetota bacterium]
MLNRPRSLIVSATSRLARLGPFAPVVVLSTVLFGLWTLSRVVLVLLNHQRVTDTTGWWWLFAIGLRMDSVQASYLLALPVVLLLVLPPTAVRRGAAPLALLMTAFAVIATYLEIASAPFLAEYDSRPNRIFIEYLKYPSEVLRTIWADQKLGIAIALASMSVVGWITWTALRGAIAGADSWSWRRRLIVLPFAAGVLFIGARGTLGHRPVNISTAAFCQEHLVNQLALNGTCSLAYAVYSLKHEHAPDRMYGRMDDAEILARVLRVAGLDEHPADPKSPTLHRPAATPRARRPNVVIFLQESLDAGFCGCLGGLGITPALDALAEEGALFTHLYATGTRTVRGIEAVISGFPPGPSASVVRLDMSQNGFFTLADLFGRNGYHTEFIYGGESHFDNMRSFMLGNGFRQIHDQPTFKGDLEFVGTWGVSDGDLVRQANDIFKSHGDQPFFALMLSTSNHTPFEFPDGHIELHDQPKSTINNAVKYADWAIGEFFRLARSEAYFKDTIFLVVADHNGRVKGQDDIPLTKFRIPGLLIGPGIASARYDSIASQIDLPVTLADLAGIDDAHPMIGVSLLRRPAGDPGRAIMQRDQCHGYRVGDRIVIHRPHAPPLQYHCDDDRLTPMPLDREFERDALAHALLPSLLYNQRAYNLPDAPKQSR